MLASHRPSTANGERVYVIGDIHGCLDLFRTLLRRIEQDVEARDECATRIIILGDFIDRGPDSAGLISAFRRIQASVDGFTVLLGNHESVLLDCAAGIDGAQRLWLRIGGDATLASFGLDAEEMKGLPAPVFARRLAEQVGSDTLDWLRMLPLTDPSGDYLFCHAGVRPGTPLDRQRREDLLWIRNEFLESRSWHGAMIVHGHSEADEVVVSHNRINIDTGAYRTGILTALGVEGTARWIISTGTEEALDGALAPDREGQAEAGA